MSVITASSATTPLAPRGGVQSALLSRRHNDANVLALGARVIGVDLATMITDPWLTAEYEGGRHADRVHQLDNA